EMPVNDFSWLRAAPVALINGRWLPPATGREISTGPCIGIVDDEIAYAVVGPEQLADCAADTLELRLEAWKQGLPWRNAGGCLIRRPWDLVEHNAEQLRLDWQRRSGSKKPQNLLVVGPADQIFVDPTAEIDPLVVADTTGGPVVVAREVRIDAFTRLEGPCYVGPHSRLLGAKLRGGTTVGPHCRVGGEVEASILHGYSNKYHDGFLGHSYVGEWVNLGAGTHNSDLRNDYGDVSVVVAGQPVATGLAKVGCFIGDHTKTG